MRNYKIDFRNQVRQLLPGTTSVNPSVCGFCGPL